MPSTSRGDSLYDAYAGYDSNDPYAAWDSAGPSSIGADVQRRPSEMLRAIAHYESGQGEQLGGLEEETYYGYDGASDDYMEEDFVNTSLLSNLAAQLRDKVPRGTHVKGSIPYPRAFTGKDIVKRSQRSNPSFPENYLQITKSYQLTDEESGFKLQDHFSLSYFSTKVNGADGFFRRR
ncbi:hypothetical protein MPER_01886 [Moniliophthora perniciosa FA553]|nr:hypothetical protein MPER_01886 [Moniliophthora perniciosa FA553]